MRSLIIPHSSFTHFPALPGQLFYSTQILVCLWFLAKNKVESNSSRAGLSGENELSLAA